MDATVSNYALYWTVRNTSQAHLPRARHARRRLSLDSEIDCFADRFVETLSVRNLARSYFSLDSFPKSITIGSKVAVAVLLL